MNKTNGAVIAQVVIGIALLISASKHDVSATIACAALLISMDLNEIRRKM